MTDLVERLRDMARNRYNAVGDLLTEAATALEAQKIQQWYRDALDEIDELLAAAKKSESRIAQLTAALEAAREDAWLPIESAPKDGAGVLLSNGVDVAHGHWIVDEGGTTEFRGVDGRYIDQDDRDGFEGWIDWSGGMNPEPTHWRPLPAPPAIDAARKENGGD